MRRLGVAILADPTDEGWPSMDLVADMLTEHLRREHHDRMAVDVVRPRIRRRVRRLMPGRSAFSVDRVLTRMVEYPRIAAELRGRHDVFHVIDHSYAQLVHRLPAGRTVVTCHDLDTFRSVLQPVEEHRPAPFRAMTRHILDGLRKAAHVTCDSAATQAALVTNAGVAWHRTTVVHNGIDALCTPAADPEADAEASTLLGPPRPRSLDLLHVGSTIPRKRIDVLLRIAAAVRRAGHEVRLIRAGGDFTPAQSVLAQQLGLERHVVVLPPVTRRVLAAVYRRAALLVLPSEREGFGLPLIEGMACGTPAVVSDIEVFREVGGTAATRCPAGDVGEWTAAIVRLLVERETDQVALAGRRARSIRQAQAFSWTRYANQMAEIYERLARSATAC